MKQLMWLRIVDSEDTWRYILLAVHARKERKKEWMRRFEIFTFTKYCDLETWVRGHSRSTRYSRLCRASWQTLSGWIQGQLVDVGRLQWQSTADPAAFTQRFIVFDSFARNAYIWYKVETLCSVLTVAA